MVVLKTAQNKRQQTAPRDAAGQWRGGEMGEAGCVLSGAEEVKR